ncbi:MAG: efflux RND transporter periplasmic adaptor subunit, partial [Bacteroidota bacterium]
MKRKVNNCLFIQKKRFHISYIILIAGSLVYSCNDSEISLPQKKDIYETVYASGKIIAVNEHNIYALSNGTIIKKWIHDGDTVKEKQPLFQIENITATSTLKVSPDKINLLQGFSSSENLSKSNIIYSDCAGIIYKTMKEQGEAVHLNEPLILIGDANNRIIKLSVDQQDIDKIKPGQQVLMKTDITGDTIYKATITKVYSLMDETSQSFRIDAVFNENFSHPFIHNGVEANIIINEKKNALVIPRTAITGTD